METYEKLMAAYDDCKVAVEKELRFVDCVRQRLLPRLDEARAVIDEVECYIALGDYALIPYMIEDANYLAGKRFRWTLMFIEYHEGRFNPRDGGEPPWSDEQEVGNYDRVADCLIEINRREFSMSMNGIGEELYYEEHTS